MAKSPRIAPAVSPRAKPVPQPPVPPVAPPPEPVTPPPPPEAAPPSAPPPPPSPPATVVQVRMTIGMEGVGVSRVPGQLLTIGDDVDEDEAGRLVDAGFAEPA